MMRGAQRRGFVHYKVAESLGSILGTILFRQQCSKRSTRVCNCICSRSWIKFHILYWDLSEVSKQQLTRWVEYKSLYVDIASICGL